MCDPTGSIGGALWIGGAQWAGKSTVARLLAIRHGLTAYHYDYHDARGHNDRLIAGGAPARDPERTWVRSSPAEMAAASREVFALRFEWALDDLRALVSGRPLLAEGWGLRPEFVAPLLDSPRRMVEFRQHHLKTLPRAGTAAHASTASGCWRSTAP